MDTRIGQWRTRDLIEGIMEEEGYKNGTMENEESYRRFNGRRGIQELDNGVPRVQVKRRPSAAGFLPAPTQMALCLRLAYINF